MISYFSSFSFGTLFLEYSTPRIFLHRYKIDFGNRKRGIEREKNDYNARTKIIFNDDATNMDVKFKLYSYKYEYMSIGIFLVK